MKWNPVLNKFFVWTTPKIKQRWKERFGEYKYKLLMDFHECDIAR